jgi:hypothetical protein
VYDNTGGQQITAGTTTTVNLDTTRINTGQFTLNIAGLLADSITVLNPGLYRIIYRVTIRKFTTAGNPNGLIETFLERDTTGIGSSFAEVDGVRAQITTEETSTGATGVGNTSTAEAILNVTANTAFRVRATNANGGVTLITYPDGSSLIIQCLNGARGPTGPAGSCRNIKVGTLMRTPILIGLTGATGISITTQPCLGTLSGLTGPNLSQVVYTPFIRIPRYPEKHADDSFTYTDSQNVCGHVHVCIDVAAPTGQFLSGNNTGAGSIVKINTNPLTQTALYSTGGNGLATNNIDGLILGSNGPNDIRYWDPVNGSTGILNISGVFGFSGAIDGTNAGTFDNDLGYYWLFNDTDGGIGETGVWGYRISFQPFNTGSTLVVKTIDKFRIFTNFALTTPYVAASTFGDSAWDPISKRIYLINTGGTEFGFITPQNTRYVGSNILGFERISQGSLGGGAPGQIAFGADGITLFGRTSGGTATFTIDRVPPVATDTLLGDPGGPSCVDCTEWPATLPL